MKRILVITRAPWLNDNGIGSTLSDFFSDFSNYEIYSLCLREATQVTSLSHRNFYISESQLIRGVIKHEPVGKITSEQDSSLTRENEEARIYSVSKKLNFMILNFARELLWSLNTWKNERLDDFLNEAKPDLVFFPDFPCVYAHKVLNYIYKKTHAKIAVFHADDCYTLKQFSVSPLFWAYRFYLRKWVRKTVKISNLNYVISDVQKEDYDRCFSVCNKVLTKFSDFSQAPELKNDYKFPLELVYTGNIGLNRWKSLSIIANALKKLNEKEIVAQLKIYTNNGVTKRIRKALDDSRSVFLMGKQPAKEMERIQKEADILVHVESMDLKNRLLVRQSFSTKIVDYLKRGRAILAFGPMSVASIKHLNDNNCAIIATSEKSVIERMKEIVDDPAILSQYAMLAYDCGKKHHNRTEMIDMLYNDIGKAVE